MQALVEAAALSSAMGRAWHISSTDAALMQPFLKYKNRSGHTREGEPAWYTSYKAVEPSRRPDDLSWTDRGAMGMNLIYTWGVGDLWTMESEKGGSP